MSRSRKKPPNITIDSNIANIGHLEFDDIDARMSELGFSALHRQLVHELATALRAELEGEQSRTQIGELIENFREISETAYAEIGKPLFLTFLRHKRQSE